MGILKKAALHLKNGRPDDSLTAMYDAFNLERVYGHFSPHDYKAWKNKDDILAGKFKAIPALKAEMERRFKLLE